MNQNKIMTRLDIQQISYRNMDSSEALSGGIREEAQKLETFYQRITSCRVLVDAPHRHHKWGTLYHVTIELGVPGGPLVVRHEPSLHNRLQNGAEKVTSKHAEAGLRHKDVYVAVGDAFKAARRQLQDHARKLRHDVKTKSCEVGV
jgi:ribosome-associated translation inhibitor RaiA